MALWEPHKQHLARFLIPEELLNAAQVESVSDVRAREVLAIHGHQQDDVSGIYFPYLSPLTRERNGGRIRLDHKTADDAKYLAEQGCRHLFFPPIPREWLEDVSVPVIIVEAEKSALAITAWTQRYYKNKLLPIAIGGCSGWKRKAGKEPRSNGNMEYVTAPSPDFGLLKLENRVVALAFDSNASTNPQVQSAREALAREMRRRGANVLIATVPDTNGINGPDDLLAELGDTAMHKLFAQAVNFSPSATEMQDMPETVLDGKLGEMCQKYLLPRFPVAYAWPALVTVASALVPRYNERQRLNLYTSLIGPVGSGKTQVIGAAQQLLGIKEPTLLNVMAGSAESLARYLNDANGDPRLFCPDELSHILEKACIQNASYASVLCRAFYEHKFTLLMQGKARAEFNTSLSILGGIVAERFPDLFGQATTAGLYDRFFFGACPSNFEFHYYPFGDELPDVFPEKIYVDYGVWQAKDEWKLSPRPVEIALRVAQICAAYDGRGVLRVGELGPAFELASYNQRTRLAFKPGEGENLEGRLSMKFISHLDRFDGNYVNKRKMLRDVSAFRYGAALVNRVLNALEFNGEIETTKSRPYMVRRVKPEEDE